MPRVLVLTPWYPTPAKPVAGVFVQELARAAATTGPTTLVHIAVEIDGPSHRSVTESLDGSLAVRQIAVRRLPGALGAIQQQLVALKEGLRDARRHGRPDVVHVHVILLAPAALLLALGWRRPLVVTVHETIFLGSNPARLGRPWTMLARLCLSRARTVIAVSDHLAEAIRTLAPRARLTVVPNVVRAEVFHANPGTLPVSGRLVSAGYLVPHKGHADIVHAVARAVRGGEDLRIVIAGDGPSREPLLRLAIDLGIETRVELPGALDKTELADLLSSASVFVLGSHYETFSVVTAEALAAGVPVVVTRCGGPEEFVDQSNGLIVDVNDIDALASAILQVNSNPSHFDRTAISTAALQRFGQPAVTRRLADVYAEAAGSRP